MANINAPCGFEATAKRGKKKRGSGASPLALRSGIVSWRHLAQRACYLQDADIKRRQRVSRHVAPQ
jgi:hypothetical protein